VAVPFKHAKTGCAEAGVDAEDAHENVGEAPKKNGARR
jgi:hypothetical protein